MGRRSPAKNELMGGKAGSLIGLEHVVGEAILRREFEVRIQNASRIVYELELRRGWTGAGAENITRAIHLAAVIHLEERSMCMAWCIVISQQNRLWIRHPPRHTLLYPPHLQ